MNKDIFKSLLGKSPLILEIGCNDGEDSLDFLNKFIDCKLYCFEPDKRAIEKFKQKINDNRCILEELCISDNDGTIDFYASGGDNPYNGEKDWDKSGSCKKPKLHLHVHNWCQFNTVNKVPSKKLDTWVLENKIEVIDLIWADVQGAEDKLIKGGMDTLLNNTRFLYTEFDNHELYEGQMNLQQLRQLLPSFSQIGIFENNVLLKNSKWK